MGDAYGLDLVLYLELALVSLWENLRVQCTEKGCRSYSWKTQQVKELGRG